MLRSQPHSEYNALKVTGVELPDGTNWRGFNYEPQTPETNLALEWSVDNAERVAEFYQRYLTQPRGEQDSGWNCHSFVAMAMGWSDVRWKGGFPGYMPKKLLPTSATSLQDGQPYAISTLGINLQHSVLGLPDPTKNLSVLGSGEELAITDNSAALKEYGGHFYRHKPPTKVDRLLARIACINDETIPIEELQQGHQVSKLRPLLSRIVL